MVYGIVYRVLRYHRTVFVIYKYGQRGVPRGSRTAQAPLNPKLSYEDLEVDETLVLQSIRWIQLDIWNLHFPDTVFFFPLVHQLQVTSVV